MAVARIHAFFFCLAALGCNSIFGIDELEPSGGATTSVTSTAQSSVATSAEATSSSSSSSGAGGVGGGIMPGGAGGAPAPRRVFVTSDTFSVMEIDSTPQANALCQNIADNNSILGGGLWRAWISDLNQDAIHNMVSDGPWNTLDGMLVFDSKADIVDTDGLFHPIVLDQNMNNRDGEPVWTGTNPDGMTAKVCANGTSSWSTLSNDSGTYGFAGHTDESWTSANTTNACAAGQARIYCFEQ